MAPLSGTRTKSTTVIKVEAFFKSRYTRYSSVSDMLDELMWLPLSHRRRVVNSVLQNY